MIREKVVEIPVENVIEVPIYIDNIIEKKIENVVEVPVYKE